jgi:hypothetical protein
MDLVVRAWLGRHDNSLEDDNARQKAARADNIRTTRTANYLLGMPLVSDYLETAPSKSERASEDAEINRL